MWMEGMEEFWARSMLAVWVLGQSEKNCGFDAGSSEPATTVRIMAGRPAIFSGDNILSHYLLGNKRGFEGTAILRIHPRYFGLAFEAAPTIWVKVCNADASCL